MTGYLLGMDVSHWQGEVDWAKAKAAGIEFAYLKAGGCFQGPYSDMSVFANAAGCRENDIAYGLYWYFDTDYAPTDQADHFIGLLKHPDLIGWRLRPAIDAEDQTAASAAAARHRLEIMANTIKYAVGILPRGYSRASWILEHVPTLGPILGQVFDWFADYTYFPPRVAGGISPDAWKIGQFSADGNNLGPTYGCESASVDLDKAKTSLLSYKERARRWFRKITEGRPL